MNQLSPKRR